jgi:hypothetical protein
MILENENYFPVIFDNSSQLDRNSDFREWRNSIELSPIDPLEFRQFDCELDSYVFCVNIDP